MSRKSLPVVAVAMLLVIALAAMGLVYGLWSETLTIYGDVHTGDVDVGLSLESVEEKVQINGGQIVDEPSEKADAANCFASLGDTDPSNGSEQLIIKVEGAYPSWHCYVTFNVESLGSVPVHIHQPEPDIGLDWVDFINCYEDETQLHQGEEAYCTILIHFTNEDGVSENGHYEFNYTIFAHQWNEEP